MAWVLKMFLSAGEAEYFFRRGLDDPNQVEFARQIEVYVRSNFEPAGSLRTAIAAADLPVGQSMQLIVSCIALRQCVLRRKLSELNFKMEIRDDMAGRKRKPNNLIIRQP
jgi:hypothetical protein